MVFIVFFSLVLDKKFVSILAVPFTDIKCD